MRDRTEEQEITMMRCVPPTSISTEMSSMGMCRIARVAAAALLFSTMLTGWLCVAQVTGGKTYATPGDAVLAVYNAAKAHDDQAMLAIFGSGGNAILHTGDPVADKNLLADFV